MNRCYYTKSMVIRTKLTYSYKYIDSLYFNMSAYMISNVHLLFIFLYYFNTNNFITIRNHFNFSMFY